MKPKDKLAHKRRTAKHKAAVEEEDQIVHSGEDNEDNEQEMGEDDNNEDLEEVDEIDDEDENDYEESTSKNGTRAAALPARRTGTSEAVHRSIPLPPAQDVWLHYKKRTVPITGAQSSPIQSSQISPAPNVGISSMYDEYVCIHIS